MSDDAAVRLARSYVRQHFRWIGGDADVWTMLRDAEALNAIVHGLAALLRNERVDVVVGIESRGFVLGPAVAVALGVGFTPVRKDGALFPGDVVQQQTAADYRGNSHSLMARRDHVRQGHRVGLVDDWIETGSQALAAAQLIERCGAQLVAIAVIIDELVDDVRTNLPPVRSIVALDDLA